MAAVILHIDSDNRPIGSVIGSRALVNEDAAVHLHRLVIACKPPSLWIGPPETPFLGLIVVQYECVPVAVSVCFRRTLWNAARPTQPTEEMVRRTDEEAGGLQNIKRQVETQRRSHEASFQSNLATKSLK